MREDNNSEHAVFFLVSLNICHAHVHAIFLDDIYMCGIIWHISENIEVDKRNVKIGGLSYNLLNVENAIITW